MKTTNPKVSALIIAISTLITFLLYSNARNTAVSIRGNSAFGGEVFLFFIPLIAYFVYRNFCDYRATRNSCVKEYRRTRKVCYKPSSASRART